MSRHRIFGTHSPPIFASYSKVVRFEFSLLGPPSPPTTSPPTGLKPVPIDSELNFTSISKLKRKRPSGGRVGESVVVGEDSSTEFQGASISHRKAGLILPGCRATGV